MAFYNSVYCWMFFWNCSHANSAPPPPNPYLHTHHHHFWCHLPLLLFIIIINCLTYHTPSPVGFSETRAFKLAPLKTPMTHCLCLDNASIIGAVRKHKQWQSFECDFSLKQAIKFYYSSSILVFPFFFFFLTSGSSSEYGKQSHVVPRRNYVGLPGNLFASSLCLFDGNSSEWVCVV